jgi:hypothetical protein
MQYSAPGERARREASVPPSARLATGRVAGCRVRPFYLARASPCAEGGAGMAQVAHQSQISNKGE